MLNCSQRSESKQQQIGKVLNLCMKETVLVLDIMHALLTTNERHPQHAFTTNLKGTRQQKPRKTKTGNLRNSQ